MKTAFLFAGQGAQYSGMGKDICEKYPCANEIFELASSALGMDMKTLCFEGPDEELMKTENTQPAVLSMDMACSSLLKELGIQADVSAGLSLGEYGALIESGVMDFAQGVKLVRKRGKYMQEAAPLGIGGMVAIMGMEREAVEKIAEESKDLGIIAAANYNYPGQIVISGENAALEKACNLAKERGGKAIPLAVSGPFHCDLLLGAGEKLREELDALKINDIRIPVFSNVTADYYEKEQVRELLQQQVSKSVFWEDILLKMLKDGVDRFIEVGPGTTLSNCAKKTAKKFGYTAEYYNVGDLKSYEALKEKWGKGK